MGNLKSSGGGSTSAPSRGSDIATYPQLNGSVYLLHEPDQPQVELVFIHGLQAGDFKDAYRKTWLARDGSDDNCWPGTWLKSRIPRARILSLSYDSSAIRSPRTGNMDLYSLAESLLPMMLSAGIGQKNCPVVFVCHSLGGLVAKQIVIHAWNQPDPDEETRALLRNIKGFFFYATPHLGSELVEYADNVLVRQFFDKGLVLEYLRDLDKNTAVLNHAFEQARRQQFKDWKLYVIGETHETKIGPIYRRIVPEASARLVGFGYMPVGEDHINVCKPKSPIANSFIKLVDFIAKDVMETQLQLGEIEDLR